VTENLDRLIPAKVIGELKRNGQEHVLDLLFSQRTEIQRQTAMADSARDIFFDILDGDTSEPIETIAREWVDINV